MTFHNSAVLRSEARAAGAAGCLSKTEITGEFFPAVETLLRARTRRREGAEAAAPQEVER